MGAKERLRCFFLVEKLPSTTLKLHSVVQLDRGGGFFGSSARLQRLRGTVLYGHLDLGGLVIRSVWRFHFKLNSSTNPLQ